jgi:hypothetical protein
LSSRLLTLVILSEAKTSAPPSVLCEENLSLSLLGLYTSHSERSEESAFSGGPQTKCRDGLQPAPASSPHRTHYRHFERSKPAFFLSTLLLQSGRLAKREPLPHRVLCDEISLSPYAVLVRCQCISFRTARPCAPPIMNRFISASDSQSVAVQKVFRRSRDNLIPRFPSARAASRDDRIA